MFVSPLRAPQPSAKLTAPVICALWKGHSPSGYVSV